MPGYREKRLIEIHGSRRVRYASYKRIFEYRWQTLPQDKAEKAAHTLERQAMHVWCSTKFGPPVNLAEFRDEALPLGRWIATPLTFCFRDDADADTFIERWG